MGIHRGYGVAIAPLNIKKSVSGELSIGLDPFEELCLPLENISIFVPLEKFLGSIL
jgi:hypothetical protein